MESLIRERLVFLANELEYFERKANIHSTASHSEGYRIYGFYLGLIDATKWEISFLKRLLEQR